MGPMFIKEPENRVDFSNTTGAIVECTARGSPRPEIIWIRADGTAVGDVPGLRQVPNSFSIKYILIKHIIKLSTKQVRKNLLIHRIVIYRFIYVIL